MNPPRQAVKPKKQSVIKKKKRAVLPGHALTAKHVLGGSLTIPKKDDK